MEIMIRKWTDSDGVHHLSANRLPHVVEQCICLTIERFHAAFPARLSSAYLIGSHGDGTAVALSDIDLVLLFTGHLADEERAVAQALSREYGAGQSVRIDLTFSGTTDPTWEKAAVKLSSRHVWGADIREQLPEPVVDDAYVQESVEYARYYIRHYLRGTASLALPLCYPDPGGEFFGYDVVREPAWYPAGTAQGVKELVNTTSIMAKTLVNLKAHRFVASKRDSIRLYRECIGGEWADYLEALYENGKCRWGYLLPDAPEERRLLRELCRQTLAFETYFLTETANLPAT